MNKENCEFCVGGKALVIDKANDVGIAIRYQNRLIAYGYDIYGLYGLNGSGKSVFLKLICGFYIPTLGEILYNGINLNNKKEFCNEIRALIEKPSFFSDLSGYENLKLLANIQKKISDKEILEALEIVNLTSEKDKKYSKYSLGMKQKLGIAQAIMEKTKFIVLDEPFNGIERETVTRIKDYLKSLKDKGVTIIISSHIKEDLNELVDEMIYFEDGEILSEAN